MDTNKQGVYSSIYNALCQQSYGISFSDLKPCKHYLKSILLSSSIYWRKGIEATISTDTD